MMTRRHDVSYRTGSSLSSEIAEARSADIELQELLPPSSATITPSGESREHNAHHDDAEALVSFHRVTRSGNRPTYNSGTQATAELAERPAQKRFPKLQGWRFGVALSATTTTVVLMINLSLVLWAGLRLSLYNGAWELYLGDCDTVDKWNLGLHLLINGCSAMLLSASNYTMQCLMSPTRSECDLAHANGDWLDIGVPSLRNLTRISWRRRVAWALIACSSIPIHLLYNSAVFKTLDANIYSVVVANNQFLESADVTIRNDTSQGTYDKFRIEEEQSSARVLQDMYQTDPSSFDDLSVSECVSTYGVPWVSGYSHIIAMTNDVNVTESRLDVNFYYSKPVFPLDRHANSWICRKEANEPSSTSYGSESAYCDVSEIQRNLTRTGSWKLKGKSIDRCLAKRTTRHCKLQCSLYSLLAVMLCNLLKILSILWTLFGQREITLVTFGDALASWLGNPDEKTRGRCLTSRLEVIGLRKGQMIWAPLNQRGKYPPVSPDFGTIPTTFDTAPVCLWWHAVSSRRWFGTLSSCVGALVLAGIFLFCAISRTEVPNPIVALGFGKIHPSALFDFGLPGNGATGFLGSAVLANLPQMVSSLLYLAFNSLYTCMHMAHEYSGYAIKHQPLRVTTPKGQQRSTYWLHLPFRYAVPLILASTLLHWMISQSMFLVSISVWNDDVENRDQSMATVGYSCAPILGTIIIGAMVLFSLNFAWDRELQYHMPIAGSCSFAISAHAHRAAGDIDAALQPVRWGVVEESETIDGVGHCTFTSEAVTEMQVRKMYAGQNVR